MTKNAHLERGPKNLGMGRPPPPSFGQCPKENIFFSLRPSLTLLTTLSYYPFNFKKLKYCLGLCVNCDMLCMQSTVNKMSEFIIRAPRRYGLRNRRDVASSFLHRSFLDCTHTVPSDSDLESESSANCLTRVSRDQLGPFQW